jgi:hypothetical protein
VSDVLMPLNLRHARTSVRYLDSSGISKGMFGGQTIVAARGGDRLGLTLEMTKHGGRTTAGLMERAQLRSWLASLRGRQNAVFAQDKSRQRRGSFPTGELLANNTFSNGTTGWSAGTDWTLSAADQSLRVSRTAFTTAGIAVQSAAVTLTAYAPYAIRYMLRQGTKSSFSVGHGGGYSGVTNLTTSTSYGMYTDAAVVSNTSVTPIIYLSDTSGWMAGDYLLIPYISLSRCALVDGGGNQLLRSDEFDNAAWTKTNTTVSANTGLTAAPDGTATADNLVETTATGVHSVSQGVTLTSGAQDVAYSVALKANGRPYCWLQLSHGTGSTFCFFNLTTGVVGTVSTGSGWSSLRTFSADRGNGWFQFSMVVRKTSSDTAITAQHGNASADGTSSYTGSTSSGLFSWRATFRTSSVPSRLTATTSANMPAGPQTGSGLYLKGLPANATGLLEIDDQVEIVTALGSELKIVTARLNSDGAGLGFLQFEPPIRTSPALDAPVIVNQPFGRFLFSGDAVGFDSEPGIWTTASAEFEEA